MKNVILISGKLRTGKNQLAEYLQREIRNRRYKVSTDAFASGVKEGCKTDFQKLIYCLDNIAEEIQTTVYNFINDREAIFKQSVLRAFDKAINRLKVKDNNWYDDKTEITRNLMQLYGTEIFRKRVDNDWWAKQLQKRVIDSTDEFILVSDCRFENEILAINNPIFENQYKTITIRIERKLPTDPSVANHDSEISLDKWTDWNYIVDNNGSLNDLKQTALTICNDILNETHEDIGMFTRANDESLLLLSELV
jgi:hypothetical protein